MTPYSWFEWPSLTLSMHGIRSLSWWSPLVRLAGEQIPQKRGGLQHVCYEIDDLESGLREAGVLVWLWLLLQRPLWHSAAAA
jgi:hypothetical protein